VVAHESSSVPTGALDKYERVPLTAYSYLFVDSLETRRGYVQCNCEVTVTIMISDAVARRWTRWDRDFCEWVHEDPMRRDCYKEAYYDE
jgi:hypothetical protein